MSCAGSRNHQTPRVSSLGQYLLQQGPGERPTSQLQPKTPCCCSAELCGRQDLGSPYRLHSCLSNLWSMGHSPRRRGSCPADGCLDSSAVSQGTHGAPLCSGCQCRAKPSPASRAPLTTGAERTAWYACVWPLAQTMVHVGPAQACSAMLALKPGGYLDELHSCLLLLELQLQLVHDASLHLTLGLDHLLSESTSI